MDKPSRLPLYVGALLAACGWVAIGLGWYQAGQQDLETGQIPFLLSGGFGGWGLLLMGATGAVLDAIRQASWRADQRHEAFLTALSLDEGSEKPKTSRSKRSSSRRRKR